MKTTLLLTVLYLGYFNVISDEAIHYTDQDFDGKLAENEITLVMFYAPWCGHCKRLKPEFDKAAAELSENDPPVTLAKVDCTTTGQKTCKKVSVESYPTLKIYKHGLFVENYYGDREAEDIVLYMQSKATPPKMNLFETLEEVENFVNESSTASAIGFFEKESLLEPVFIKLSKELWDKIQFGYTTIREAFEKYKINDQGIVLFRPNYLRNKFEEDQLFYKGGADYTELKDFITTNQHGLVGHRIQSNTNEFKPPFIVVYFFLDYEDNAQLTKYWRNRILIVAKKFTGRGITFGMSSKIDFKSELQEYGITELALTKPTAVGRDKNNKKYVMKDEFSVANLETFANDLLNGNLEPYIKSQPIPHYVYGGNVITAVAKNFEKLLSKTTKDVFVVFYSDDCSYETSSFYKLGPKLQNENIEIIMIDFVENEIPEKLFEIHDCPTVYWVPKNDKTNPVLYTGKNRVKDLLKYVAEHASVELKNFDRYGNPKEKEEL